MNNFESQINLIRESLQRGKPCILAIIVNSSGSTPRHTGSKMVIDSEGDIWGTIGGSLLEAAAIKQAKSAFSEASSSLMEFNLDNDNVDLKGMICGGKALVLLDYISPGKDNEEFFFNLSKAVRNGRRVFLLLALKKLQGSHFTVSRNLIFSDGILPGNSFLTPGDISKIRNDLVNISVTTWLKLENSSVIIDPVIKIKKLYCIGAGHVARPTAQLASTLGFEVIVVDDRSEFANKERFPQAQEIRVIDDYSQAFLLDEMDADTYITILTRGHLFDRIAIELALKTKAYYIGMMASRKKKESIFAALKEQGFSEKDLSRVHSPIGLDIDAETPEEIAVSICAELIKERAKQQK
jgi:xanthine dehydrogenase accessory factor